MNTKLLKQKILDLAIRGKLVPQDPNDEPASVLLERIRAEKERLVAEGKIKRSKSTTDNRHYENVPFEIPDSWEWVRLSDIADVGTGATPKTNIKEYYNGDIPWITSSSTQWEIIDKPVSLISKKAVDETNCKIYKAGTIIIAMYGEGKTRGQVSELAIDSATNQACAAISLFNVELKDYVKAFLKYSYGGIRYLSVGGVQPNLNLKVIEQFKIPLPPHSEQLRIVTEIKRWFALIEDLEENKGALLEAIKQAKSKILSFAISGKLVAQDPNDEPAIELLKRINPNFIPCDNSHYGNVPFGIPMNWIWVKGSNIFNPMKSTRPQGEYFDYIDIDAIDNKQNKITAPKHILSKNAPSRAAREVSMGDVLFSMVRPYLKNIAKVENDGYIASTGFYVCKPNIALTSDYCFYLMISDYVVDGLNSFMKGDNSPSINNENLLSWLYPIPPISEQKRITKVIDKLFYLLDKIVTEL